MTTRSKKKDTAIESSVPHPKKNVENSWVILVNDSVLENEHFNIITLPHPASGMPMKYCLDDKHSKMYEVITYEESFRSWFIGESVKSVGNMLICTPVDPTFLVLPRLRTECKSRAIPLEDLLSEKGFDKMRDFVNTLEKVADLKGPADIKAYKYNEDKALNWLEEKVRKVANVLKDKKIHVRSGAVSSTFVASHTDSDSLNEEFYLKYSFGLVSEYLEDDLRMTLEKRFNFTPDLIESLSKKRKSEIENGSASNKKIKVDPDDDHKENGFTTIFPNSMTTEIKKEKPLSAKEKARQKAASGTKTISSFFTKK